MKRKERESLIDYHARLDKRDLVLSTLNQEQQALVRQIYNDRDSR